MKNYGKYEKRPEGVPVKQPKVKNALLQTYFTSLLCMVLCVTMFFGTSYAWFTSEVNNVGNEIYIGTLDVGLFKQSVSDQETVLVDLSEDGNKLFDGDIRWEPGYTTLETIEIVNEGDLAFKYVLNFTDGSLAEGSTQSIENVAEYFDVWVYDHRANEDKTDVGPNPASYAQIIGAGSGWVNAGSLDQLLSGKIVLDGVMVTVRQDDKPDDETTPNDTDNGVKTVDTYTIALHMKEETNDTALMGQRISLNVKLVAYQMASENDGFESGVYDDITAVSDEEGLKSALSAGGNVLLTSHVNIEDAEDRVTMNGGILDGNGKTVSYTVTKGENDPSLGVVTTTGGIVRNLTVDGGTAGRALYITTLSSDLVVSNCNFSGVYAFNLSSADETNYTMHFTDTTFASWTSYANVMEHAYFTDCEFEGVLRPYGDTTLTNCTFTTEGLDVSELEANETITLINCTYNGVPVEKAVLTANGEVITIEESSVIIVNEDKEVVLKTNG